MSKFPLMFRVRQSFQRERVADPAAEVDAQLRKLRLETAVRSGQSVAITAGSRGIANIAIILKGIVDHCKALGAEPFIVPAMGSHGGGTAAGQQRLIESYGITESFCGCPIRSSMETAVVCQADEGFPVHFDRHAYDADHVIVCGRVKPHTGFVGDVESGMMKMMLIGLGKHEGAKVYHRAIKDYSFGQIVRSVAREVLAKCKVLAGVAIVENAYDQTAKIAAVAPAEIEEREKELLVLARQWMPRLPFETADILLIDEIGKNISGTGMDTNVIGRKFYGHVAADDEWPKVKRVLVRGLTPETHGNAVGIGYAEFCLSSVIEQMDAEGTRINALTAGHPTVAMLPIDFPTDQQLLENALPTLGLVEPADARLLWIHSTLHVEQVECSVAYLDEARRRDDLEVITEPRPLPLDAQGNLCGVNELGHVPASVQASP